MVKSYCVKEKKQTECVPGSERYVITKNGRSMMKCQCASCGITKAKFVKSGTTGSGIRTGSNVTTKPYCGIKKVPKGRHLGDAVDCKNQIRYWGVNKVDKKILDEFIKNKKEKQKIKRKMKKLNLN